MSKVRIKHVRLTQPRYHSYTTNDQTLIVENRRIRIREPIIDDFLRSIKVHIKHASVSVASYSILDDFIKIPFKSKFIKLPKVTRTQNYYSTLFHEIIHWTGNKKRLNRKSLTKYRDYKPNSTDNWNYVLEEITAELGSILLMKYFRLHQTAPMITLSMINKELSYIDSEDQNMIYKLATEQAIEAFNYLKSLYE